MHTTNKVGIRIAGITLALALAMFGLSKAVAFLVSQTPETPATTPNPTSAQIVQPPSPATTLPPELQKQISAYKESANETLGEYTKKYIQSLPAESEKNEVLAPTKVEEFVNTNKEALLPALFAGTVKTTTASGKEAIVKYLDAIAPSHNPAIKPVTGEMISAALIKQESGEDIQALAPVHASIESNFNLFKNVQAPKEAVELHTKLLQATLALMNNVTLLQNIQKDFVGGLIGQKNLADLNAVFTEIGTQILALETKYNIK
ncbi:MAG: hypothetical protein O3A36_00305 [bacterium]|nr:hypothetical protein [bacterium]